MPVMPLVAEKQASAAWGRPLIVVQCLSISFPKRNNLDENV